jgi:hypothetical protein
LNENRIERPPVSAIATNQIRRPVLRAEQAPRSIGFGPGFDPRFYWVSRASEARGRYVGAPRPRPTFKYSPFEVEFGSEPAEIPLAVAVESFFAPLPTEPLIPSPRLGFERLFAGQAQCLKIAGETFSVAERIPIGSSRFNLVMAMAAALPHVSGEFAIADLCWLEGRVIWIAHLVDFRCRAFARSMVCRTRGPLDSRRAALCLLVHAAGASDADVDARVWVST